MLVLSRKIGEEILLPNRNVSVVVLGIQGNRVRIGIQAPPDEPVYRGELWQRKIDAEELETYCEVLLEV